MNIQEYIESGVLEEYCLGLLDAGEQAVVLQLCALFPEVKNELRAIERAIEHLAVSTAVDPNPDLKQKILNSLGFPEPAISLDLDNLPETNAWSNHRSWLNTLKHLIPAVPDEDFVCHVLRQDNRFAQMLVITKKDVPKETHANMRESFFILKGECRCSIENNFFVLGPGDFLEIPLYKEHDIKITTPYVVAILQHQYI